MRFRCVLLVAALLGVLAVGGYAPFSLYPLPILTLAALFALWARAGSARQAMGIGAAYGLGLFGAGVSWVYVSLHDFGGMPLLPAVLSTAVFCAFLALFPALAGGLALRFGSRRVWAMPALWVLMEWVLGWIFTGFPWMTLGYSQVSGSPLAGVAPVFGILGVSLAAAVCAALLSVAGKPGQWRISLAGVLLVLLSGWGLKQMAWSRPVGAPLSVSLLQGNIAQGMKWEAETLESTLDTYLNLARAHPARLMILPETAIPLLARHVPQDFLDALSRTATAAGGDVLVGLPEDEAGRYYNSMMSLGSAPVQRYRKSHLVPFGEFIPFKPVFGWIYESLLHIPLADLSSGGRGQRPLRVSGQRVAVSVCYEDVFGEEIIRQLPEATLLANASNDAWYGRSLASHQHLRIAQARALETGRMMLRATNTGATAIIGVQGELVATIPHFTAAALVGVARGYVGTTPYVRWGNGPILALLMLALGLLWGRKNK